MGNAVSETSDNQLFRVEVEKTKDGGKAQTANLLGRDGEKLGGEQGVLRIQAHGISSHAPKGSHGVVLVIGGNSDQALLLGLEHPDHRPTELAEGDTKIYDAFGQSFHFKNGEAVMNVTKLTIIADTVVIESPDINLGGMGGKPVAVQGTKDSAGHTLVSDFATTVKAV